MSAETTARTSNKSKVIRMVRRFRKTINYDMSG
jgi:hypothetical protein